MTSKFENLVSYERYKTAVSFADCQLPFENLVSYERYKTIVRVKWMIEKFENLVSYERYKTALFTAISEAWGKGI